MIMNNKMAKFYLYVVVASLFIGGTKGIGDDFTTKSDLKERQPFSIEHIENGPDLMVNVPGIEKPLCFNLENREETLRIIQDPRTGVVVNAQILYDNLNNKTYVGAVLVAKENICLLATQYVVLVNNARFNWGPTRVLSIDGHRVVISEDTVLVTFRQCRISLFIHRHNTTRENNMEFNEVDRESYNRPSMNNVSETDSKEVTESEDHPEVLPVIGYAESESIINQLMSSKRRRGLLLQNFFGINQDGAVVRNSIIEVESEGRKKRDDETGVTSSTPLEGHVLLEKNDAGESHQQQKSSQRHHGTDQFPVNEQKQHMQNSHRSRRSDKAKYSSEPRIEREAERKRDSAIYLDMYIADSRDFSNRTHGLLGQFLVKNVTREKIRYKDGKMTARLLVQDNPSRRTNALFSSRFYAAVNATRACWKIRHNGRDILDGKHSDYVVPNIWYRNLKDLPPPAPL